MSIHQITTAPSNVPKATGTVEIAEPGGKLTLSDRQLFNHLLAHAYRRLTTDEWHTVQMSEIRRFAAEARGGTPENDNRRMKEIDRLAEFRVLVIETRQGPGRGGDQVVAVTFQIERKPKEAAAATIRELEKPKVQRRGERKAKAEDIASTVAARKALHFLTGADAFQRD